MHDFISMVQGRSVHSQNGLRKANEERSLNQPHTMILKFIFISFFISFWETLHVHNICPNFDTAVV